MTDDPSLDDPLVVVANRLPIRRNDDGTWRIAAGGLVTAMRPIMQRTGGTWVGWDGGDEGTPDHVDELGIDVAAVQLSQQDIDEYYHGFSNRTLWPLVHDLVAEPVIDHTWWETYVEVNTRFADRVVEMDPDPDAVIWVHDYHLMLLPGMLRERLPDQQIGFFLHTPYPAPELMSRLPWRDQLLEGLLGADVVGFHTQLYRDNFLRSVDWLVPGCDVRGTTATHDGRSIDVRALAISIDADEFAELSTSRETEEQLTRLRNQFGGRKVFLGVDRLDTTKGIRHRLAAIEELLKDDPVLREQFVFVQIAVPSREDVAEVQELRRDVERLVGRINGEFTEPGHDVPVHYLYRGVPRPTLAAYYRLADVLCVTPLKDGMNLVAKEFSVVQHAAREDGVLLLSEFTGAALTMDGAVTCNPFDTVGLAETMADCLTLGVDDRRERLQRMADEVHRNDVFAWGLGLVTELQAADDGVDARRPPEPATTTTAAALVERVGPVDQLLVVLDFDGTLAPLVEHPDDATLAPGARDAIGALVERTTVVVLTGRPVDDVLPRLGGLPVGVVGGHGTQAVTVDGDRTWLLDVEEVRATLDEVTPHLRELVDEDAGWYVEPKPTSVGVHRRRVAEEDREPTLSRVRRAMDAHLDTAPGWKRQEGHDITELQPDGVDKGTALRWLLDRHDATPLVIGDDVTDEDAFAVARDHDGHAVLVATEPRDTHAQTRVATPADVVAFLQRLAEDG